MRDSSRCLLHQLLVEFQTKLPGPDWLRIERLREQLGAEARARDLAQIQPSALCLSLQLQVSITLRIVEETMVEYR